MDPRHKKRIRILQNLYAFSFKNDQNNLPYKEDGITGDIIANLELIDSQIQKYAPKFPLDKISKIDLSILRLSIYDLIIIKKTPAKVIIDEAVELAKEFGGDKSFAFINAILGKVYQNKTQNENKS